ncbi:MAG: hypothetical protein FJW94_11690, partial [Actinobacteria bacterium]|nr:hypothetical protein [Actinomycetota bacterium]
MNRSRLFFPMIAVMALAAACVMPPPPGPTTTTTSTTTTTAPPQDVDGDGFNTLSDCDDADPSINPGAADPAGDEIDSNCDGIDGVQSAAVFVNSTTGGDTSTCGIITEPCATIGQGQFRAVTQGKASVFVAGGSYPKFTVTPGLEVRGGYGQNYQRGIAATGTTIAVVNASFDASVGGPVAMIADGVTTRTTIADLRLAGVTGLPGSTAGTGQVSTTVLVRNSTSALVLDSLQVNGGNAGAGANGAAGTAASSSPASVGQGGGNGSEPGGVCNNSTAGGGGAGVGGGGNGGSGGTVDTNCGVFSLNLNARGGNGGGNGFGASGSSGIGGGGGQAGTDGLPGICTIGGGPAV